MTEQELLEKIVEVIENTEFVTGCYPKNIVNIKQRTTYDSHSSFTNFVTTISFDFACVLADALLRSEIGDVKDLQVQVNSLEITNIALQAGYDDAEKDRLYWVDKYKEAEHRADKAEKDRDAYKIALRKALKTDNCAKCFSTISVDNECFTQWGCDRGNEKCINTLFKQAEKELQEEKKDD